MNKIDRKIESIAKKMQEISQEIHRKNCCYFIGCDNAKDVLFRVGAKTWIPVMLSEGYSEKYCNSSVYSFSKNFMKIFNRVAEKWEEIDYELINKLNKINNN